MDRSVVGIDARICIVMCLLFVVWMYGYRSGVLVWAVVCVAALVGCTLWYVPR